MTRDSETMGSGTGTATGAAGCSGTGAGVGEGERTVTGGAAFGTGSFIRFLMDGLALTTASGATKLIEDFTGVRISMAPCAGADRLGFSALP